MKRILVADSSLELNDELAEKMEVRLVPFRVDIGQTTYIDDGTVDQQAFLAAMKDYPHAPKSAAPAPGAYLEAFGDAEEVFVITLSQKLSASYNNAVLAKQMREEQNAGAKIHVFDSKSAVCGETLVAAVIQSLLDLEASFDSIVKKVEARIDESFTFFVLESLENLIKNGRISRWKGAIAGALSIMPVMHAQDGEIALQQMARGRSNAYGKLVDVLGTIGVNFAERTLYISHCNAREVAEEIRDKIEQRYRFHDIQLTGMKVLSSMYANAGGIVLSF